MKFIKLWIFVSLSFFACSAKAAEFVGFPVESLQITTNVKCVVGNPTWLLILRDVDSGQVLPYVYDFRNPNNFWVAFSTGHHYRIVASQLKFGNCVVLNNFCNLESGCPISRKSLTIRVTGRLTPDPCTVKCRVSQYTNYTSVIPRPIIL